MFVTMAHSELAGVSCHQASPGTPQIALFRPPHAVGGGRPSTPQGPAAARQLMAHPRAAAHLVVPLAPPPHPPASPPPPPQHRPNRQGQGAKQRRKDRRQHLQSPYGRVPPPQPPSTAPPTASPHKIWINPSAKEPSPKISSNAAARAAVDAQAARVAAAAKSVSAAAQAVLARNPQT